MIFACLSVVTSSTIMEMSGESETICKHTKSDPTLVIVQKEHIRGTWPFCNWFLAMQLRSAATQW